MKPLASLGLALLASVVLYLAVFSQVRRPLTVGDVAPMLRDKWARAEALPSPKLVVLAGSNGRYSHRCAALAAELGLPCVNLSVAVGIGLDFQLDEAARRLRRGDVVYLPLEYAQYGVERAQMQGGTENWLYVHDFPERLAEQPPLRIARAWASFDLAYLVHGVAETALAARGVQRRSGVSSLTAEGDEQRHGVEAAAAYRDFLRATLHRERPLPPDPHAMHVIGAFLETMRRQGVLVVGGLPTLPINAEVPEDTLTRLRALYRQHGQPLLELDNASRYALECFFDTPSHLHEPCQLRHSRAVGRALRAWVVAP